MKPMKPAAIRTVRPEDARPCAFPMATTIARMVHAVTSSTAAHVIAVLPSGVRVRPRSSRIRASTGKAMMLIAMPMKSANGTNGTPAGAKLR
jgi:hypothetical protein